MAVQHEAAEQMYLMQWAHCFSGNYPELDLLFHIPNGGSRNKFEAANLKRQGVKAGVPDLFLPVPRGGYHGLFIEMKYGKNKPTGEQKEWMRRLEEQAYKAAVCYGWQEAADLIMDYLKLK